MLRMYFLVKFCPYISVFDKVTALLISWECDPRKFYSILDRTSFFDHRVDGKFKKDRGHMTC